MIGALRVNLTICYGVGNAVWERMDSCAAQWLFGLDVHVWNRVRIG